MRDDGLLRCYDSAGYGYTHEYDRRDWSVATLQWQLALAGSVHADEGQRTKA